MVQAMRSMDFCRHALASGILHLGTQRWVCSLAAELNPLHPYLWGPYADTRRPIRDILRRSSYLSQSWAGASRQWRM